VCWIRCYNKPNFATERQRIAVEGAQVHNGRVYVDCHRGGYGLAVSRALGNSPESKNVIISTPDVTHHKLALDEDKFIVVACDGLFDVFSNQECVEWFRQNVQMINDKKDGLQAMTHKLCNEAIDERESLDNVSVCVICINPDIDVQLSSNAPFVLDLGANANASGGGGGGVNQSDASSMNTQQLQSENALLKLERQLTEDISDLKYELDTNKNDKQATIEKLKDKFVQFEKSHSDAFNKWISKKKNQWAREFL